MKERWRPIPEAVGYRVSSLGRIKNASNGRVLVVTVWKDYL